jgi:hypothetical protein
VGPARAEGSPVRAGSAPASAGAGPDFESAEALVTTLLATGATFAEAADTLAEGVRPQGERGRLAFWRSLLELAAPPLLERLRWLSEYAIGLGRSERVRSGLLAALAEAGVHPLSLPAALPHAKLHRTGRADRFEDPERRAWALWLGVDPVLAGALQSFHRRFANLDLRVTALPDGLKLVDNLVGGGDLVTLGRGFEVGGFMNLGQCAGLSELPDHLHLEGYLRLTGTAVRTLPRGLRVGALELDGCVDWDGLIPLDTRVSHKVTTPHCPFLADTTLVEWRARFPAGEPRLSGDKRWPR